MESGLIATLFSLAIIVGLFLLFRVVVWWYWGIDKALKNLENMQNQLEGINHKMNLFAEKFDVVDNSKEEFLSIKEKKTSGFSELKQSWKDSKFDKNDDRIWGVSQSFRSTKLSKMR